MTSVLIAFVMAAAPVPNDIKAEEQFRAKIDPVRVKAIKFLRDKQNKDGGWEGLVFSTAGLKGGPTALATLSLLEAGVPANDEAIIKAVDFLLKLKPDKTYVVSLQTQVLARVDAKKYAKEIQDNADWLMTNVIIKDGKLQGWSYPANAIADNSNTHFAVMALHVASQAGSKVDDKVWQKIRDYYADTQMKDGSWTYHNAGDKTPSHSMMVAALLCLTIATKHDKNAKGPDDAFHKGMDVLLSGKMGELGSGKSAFVAWMVTAELGRAMDVTVFKSSKAAKTWYREGAEKILKEQQKDGSFQSGGAGIDAGQPVITTACALYFFGPPAKK